MVTASKTSTEYAVTGAAAAEKSDSGDADLFARELGSRLSSDKDKVSASLEKLAAAFPGMAVTNKVASGTSEIKDYFLKSGEFASISINAETMAQMADDEKMFDSVKEMLSRVFSAGQEQKLVNTGAADTSRHISIQGSEVRYVEVQRGVNGSQMSVSSLAMSAKQSGADLFDLLFPDRSQNAKTASGATSRNRGFEGMVSNSSTWRFESFISGQSINQVFNASPGNTASGLTQTLVASQTFTASLELVIEKWSNSGGSGADLLSYIRSMQLSDPLVLDLGDEGINLSGAEDGVYFDIKGDGSPVRTAFIRGNNAFLYLDGNGNGVVDDVSELFGDFGGFANGFAKLAQYDDNGDGVIDENDAIYSQLRLWRDLNGDGINQIEESLTLAEAGVRSISLRHDDHMALDGNGNVIGERSFFTRTDGSTGLMADVWLRSK